MNPINTQDSLIELNQALEAKKWTGTKQTALKTLGLSLKIAAVALFIFSVKCICSQGIPGLMVLSAACFVVSYGIKFSQIASNNRLEIAQRLLNRPNFVNFANSNNIQLTIENVYKTIDLYVDGAYTIIGTRRKNPG